MSKKILILSTDAAHHRYFINFLLQNGISLEGCYFETTSVKPPFETGPLFEDTEKEFEMENFFRRVPFELNLEATNVQDINNEASIAKIKCSKADFGIVFGTRRLSPELISAFRDGLINVHRGMSEEYRGLDSDLWAIYHGDYGNIGVTIHKVAVDLDVGDIVYQQAMPLVKNMKVYQIRYYTTLISSELALRATLDYLEGCLKSRPQTKRGRYYSFMPLVLKNIVANKFEKYCEKLDG